MAISNSFDSHNTTPASSEKKDRLTSSSRVQLNTVLVAEDDPVNGIFLKNILEKNGYRVDLAQDGHEALRLWKEHRKYDAILMDIQMPGIDGIETTEKIRKIEEQEHTEPIRIIGISAYGTGNEKNEMYGVGITDYISKPIHTRRLLSLIGSSSEGPEEDEEEGNPAQPGESSQAYENRLLEEYSDGKETLADMLRMSLHELPQRLWTIENSIHEENFEKGAEQCHSLANVASILLAQKLREEALDLERLFRNREGEEIAARFESVKRKTESMLDTFRKLLEENL